MKLKREDIGYKLDNLFEIVGEDKFLEIAKMYGGANIYVPTYKSVIRNSRNREILRRYNGVNSLQLAKEYNMCVNQINRIVSELR